MKKSSKADFTYRVNTALSVYHNATVPAEAISILTKRFNVSKRQAYRYLQEALRVGRAQPIPESKSVFTVKLPQNHISQLRACAKDSDIQISVLLESILNSFFKTKKKDG